MTSLKRLEEEIARTTEPEALKKLEKLYEQRKHKRDKINEYVIILIVMFVVLLIKKICCG